MDASLLNYSDDELWNEVVHDNYHAFEIIHQRYSLLLFNSAFALLKERQVCEDILQDVFVNIWIRRSQLNIHSLKSYLLKSMRNGVLMYFRERKAFIDISMIENNVAAFYSIEKSLADKNLLNDIYKKVEILPEKCKEIFILSRKYQLSNKEISERLNISTKTVENQITIAIKKLKPFLENAYFFTLVLMVTEIYEYISF